MEEPSIKHGVFQMNRRLRIVVGVLAYAVLGFVCFAEIAGCRWVRVTIACACQAILGYFVGFQPQAKESRRSLVRMTIFMHMAALLIPVAYLVGIFALPVDQRYAAMLRLPFLGTYALLLAAMITGYLCGRGLFRWRWPSQAIVETAEEESEEEEAEIRSPWLLLRALAAGFLGCSPMFVALVFYHEYFPRVAFVNVLLLIGVFSLFIGLRWKEHDRITKLVWLVSAILGPAAGGLAACGEKLPPDPIHLERGLHFAGLTAGAFFLPTFVVRLVARVTRG